MKVRRSAGARSYVAGNERVKEIRGAAAKAPQALSSTTAAATSTFVFMVPLKFILRRPSSLHSSGQASRRRIWRRPAQCTQDKVPSIPAGRPFLRRQRLEARGPPPRFDGLDEL